MLSANQGNYWYHFYNAFGMTRSLNLGPPALEASTIPLGYRGGCTFNKSLSFTEGRDNYATKAAINLGETIIYIYVRYIQCSKWGMNGSNSNTYLVWVDNIMSHTKLQVIKMIKPLFSWLLSFFFYSYVVLSDSYVVLLAHQCLFICVEFNCLITNIY